MENRLRHRKVHLKLQYLQELKDKLCYKRLEVVKHIKSPQWTQVEVNSILKSLKNNKCRDPEGYINEIFKDGVAGEDLKKSICHILNRIKDTLEIPDMLKNVNIAMIPKPGKRSLGNIENQRGIFIINILRSLLMKILLKDEYETLDSFMSDSNIGGRKGRRIQDHLFIINGIIFEHARNTNSNPLKIGIYDYKQCFDSLWQEEILNDLYDAGIQNNKLSLLYKINQTNKIAVKTHHGISQRKTFNMITCQGEPMGLISCSVQVDTIGRDSLDPF